MESIAHYVNQLPRNMSSTFNTNTVKPSSTMQGGGDPTSLPPSIAHDVSMPDILSTELASSTLHTSSNQLVYSTPLPPTTSIHVSMPHQASTAHDVSTPLPSSVAELMTYLHSKTNVHDVTTIAPLSSDLLTPNAISLSSVYSIVNNEPNSLSHSNDSINDVSVKDNSNLSNVVSSESVDSNMSILENSVEVSTINALNYAENKLYSKSISNISQSGEHYDHSNRTFPTINPTSVKYHNSVQLSKPKLIFPTNHPNSEMFENLPSHSVEAINGTKDGFHEFYELSPQFPLDTAHNSTNVGNNNNCMGCLDATEVTITNTPLPDDSTSYVTTIDFTTDASMVSEVPSNNTLFHSDYAPEIIVATEQFEDSELNLTTLENVMGEIQENVIGSSVNVDNVSNTHVELGLSDAYYYDENSFSSASPIIDFTVQPDQASFEETTFFPEKDVISSEIDIFQTLYPITSDENPPIITTTTYTNTTTTTTATTLFPNILSNTTQYVDEEDEQDNFYESTGLDVPINNLNINSNISYYDNENHSLTNLTSRGSLSVSNRIGFGSDHSSSGSTVLGAGLLSVVCVSVVLATILLAIVFVFVYRRCSTSRKVYVTPSRVVPQTNKVNRISERPQYDPCEQYPNYDDIDLYKCYLTKPMPPAIMPLESQATLYRNNEPNVSWAKHSQACIFSDARFNTVGVTSSINSPMESITSFDAITAVEPKRSKFFRTTSGRYVPLKNDTKRTRDISSKALQEAVHPSLPTPPYSRKGSISTTLTDNTGSENGSSCNSIKSNELHVQVQIHVDSEQSDRTTTIILPVNSEQSLSLLTQNSTSELLNSKSVPSSGTELAGNTGSNVSAYVEKTNISMPGTSCAVQPSSQGTATPSGVMLYSSNGGQTLLQSPRSLMPRVTPPAYVAGSQEHFM